MNQAIIDFLISASELKRKLKTSQIEVEEFQKAVKALEDKAMALQKNSHSVN